MKDRRVFKWYKGFREKRTRASDDPGPGRPKDYAFPENIRAVKTIIETLVHKMEKCVKYGREYFENE